MFWKDFDSIIQSVATKDFKTSNTDQQHLFCFSLFSPQEEAGSLLVNLSSSLKTISVHQLSRGDEDEVVHAATPIVEAASNILNVSSNVQKNFTYRTLRHLIPLFSVAPNKYALMCYPQKKVSDFLLTGINNIQTALLNNKKVDGQPAIIDSGQISVYVNR